MIRLRILSGIALGILLTIASCANNDTPTAPTTGADTITAPPQIPTDTAKTPTTPSDTTAKPSTDSAKKDTAKTPAKVDTTAKTDSTKPPETVFVGDVPKDTTKPPVVTPPKDTTPTPPVVTPPKDTTPVIVPPVVTPPKDSSVDTGGCVSLCDANQPSQPIINGTKAIGNVTTYGSVTDKERTWGGACGYGNTEIRFYAAIQVDKTPGLKDGQWNDGHLCGQCIRVRARTATGWKSTVVRITDKCPDGACGIDLGGAPAYELMGMKPGRYMGEWEYVSCDGQIGVSDGEPTIWVKNGSGDWWSVIQVRNGPASVLSMDIRKVTPDNSAAWDSLRWKENMENFYTVPKEILQDSSDYEIRVSFWGGQVMYATVTGVRPGQFSQLARPDTYIPLRKP